MVKAWVYVESAEDQRHPHQGEDVSLGELAKLGVHYWHVPVAELDMKEFKSQALDAIRRDRGYKNYDVITISPQLMPNYEEKVRMFFQEHLHTDEEIRYVLNGGGYFDVRSGHDRWIRIKVEPSDLIVLPEGIFHRFSTDTNNFAHVMRLFADEPRWKAYNREEGAESMESRAAYLALRKRIDSAERRDATGPNGTPFILADGAKALANYPHMRRAGGFLYVSGLSSRRADNSHVGAVQNPDGSWTLSMEDQTRGVIENLRKVLATAGASLKDVVDLTVFLVDMKDYAEYNRIYDTYFDALSGPTRTTVSIRQLPHPNLLIEIKAVAVAPQLMEDL